MLYSNSFSFIPYSFASTVIQWNLISNEDHENYLVISRVNKQRNTKGWDQHNYLERLLEEGFVISDLFIMRIHCTKIVISLLTCNHIHIAA